MRLLPSLLLAAALVAPAGLSAPVAGADPVHEAPVSTVIPPADLYETPLGIDGSPGDAYPAPAPAEVAPTEDASGTVLEAPVEAGALLPLDSADAAPDRLAFLATSVLHFVPGEDERLEEDGVIVLPVPLPWPLGSATNTMQLAVPAGKPVFLLASIAPFDEGAPPASAFTSMPDVSVDGVPLQGLAERVIAGVGLSDGVSQAEHAAVAFTLAPFTPGRHVVQVACSPCAPLDGPWLKAINGTARTYVLDVTPPSDLAPAPSPLVAPSAAVAGASTFSVQLAASSLLENLLPGRATGTVLERRVDSAALGRELPYRIYLPAGYNPAEGSRRYPVLYLLHGLGGSATQWGRLGFEAELDRQQAKLIVVMPTGRTGYWVNHADGGPRWGDYVARDLVSHIDATYRTIPEAGARAIGGLSMGAHGALQLTLNYPDVFGVTGAHSPALRTRDQAPAFLGGLLLTAGAAPPPVAYALRDPITLIARSVLQKPPVLWMDTGEADPWFKRAEELRATARARGWDVNWRPGPGGHSNDYWLRRVPEYVRWYREQLERA